jgi:hypothetical protein
VTGIGVSRIRVGVILQLTHAISPHRNFLRSVYSPNQRDPITSRARATILIWRLSMRTLILALALGCAAFAMPSAPAAAQTLHYAPWCSQIPENNTECTFISERQCLETVAGNGGYCEPNPGFAEDSPFASERRARHHKHG